MAALHEIRVALIGYGMAGAYFHAPLIASTPGLRITAIVTGNVERATGAAQEHPGALVLPTTEDLWRYAEDVDLVVVATPNDSHVPLAEQALDRRLAVVVDKPLAPTAAQARSLIQRAARAGRMLTVFQNRRWDGDFMTVRQLLEQGRLGTPHRFESRFERWRPVPRPSWRLSAAPEMAGGVLFDLGSHLIDQALVLFGPVKQVYAEVDARTPGAGVDEDAFVALTHASGVRSHLWMSSVAAQPGPRIRVLGSEAAFTKFGLDVQEAAMRAGARPGDSGWGEDPQESWGELGAGEHRERVPTLRGAYEEFYAGVARALRNGTGPPVDPSDAVRTLEIIEAAHRFAAGR